MLKLALRRISRRLALAGAFCMLLPVWATTTSAQELVVPPGTPVADRTLDMWSARWWMWASSFNGKPSPIRDMKGDLCGLGQDDDVFFLAGSFENRAVERTCKVPAGKPILFPLVTYIVLTGQHMGCDYYRAMATRLTDGAEMRAELDGVPIPDLGKRRAASNCFDINARTDLPRRITASNGYWVLLNPLPKGTHKLRFASAVPSKMQDISYTLVVD